MRGGNAAKVNTRTSATTANKVALGLLVPVLAAFGWIASADLRTGWSDDPRNPAEPGPNGWASIARTSVRVAGFEEVGTLENWDGTPWTPPDGYRLWRLEVEVRSRLTEPRFCTVEVRDAEGRTFTPPGPDAGLPETAASTLDCGSLEEDPSLSTMVLMPVESRPATVRLLNDYELAPAYFSLPLR
ncbi:hypothetical protein [Georgenia deserti]|uniref:Uncharacterized protein n=1 Tax=Georgenia deserti TaxID=2093781 RepID=A0ABW4L818_9MICO